MNNWIRLYTIDEVCPICEREDGCSISKDGKTICCSRVQSDKLIGVPFAGGWLHPATKKYNKKLLKKPVKTNRQKNWNILQEYFVKNLRKKSYQLKRLEKEWDVPKELILKLGVGFDKNYFTIPMYNEVLSIIGIQKRYLDGSKKVFSGSELGLFLGWDVNKWPNDKKLIICEGFSDTITAADFGVLSVGRPSCGTGIDLVIDLIELLGISESIVISDNGNDAERWGAELMLKTLPIKSKLILPPSGIKDLRQWKQKGLTKGKFYGLIQLS